MNQHPTKTEIIGELAPTLDAYRAAGYLVRRTVHDPAYEAARYEVRDPANGALYTTLYVDHDGTLGRDPYTDTRPAQRV